MVEIATVDELRNNFDKYVKMILDGNSILMMLGNQQIGRIIPKDAGTSAIKALTGFLNNNKNNNLETETPITDSLIGIAKSDYDLETAKDEYFREKYGLAEIMTGGV